MQNTRGNPADAPSLRDPQSHAVLDESSRLAKARKIVALITAERPLTGLRVLEVGCGSGHISCVLASHVGPDGRLQALDVTDVRCTDAFNFALYDGDRLPFDAQSFDVVISNHTIEHVGDSARQLEHIAEIGRVLAPGGLVYIAAPNRWFPWEAHYRLPLLGWLPHRLADVLVRLSRRGDRFDVYPLSRPATRSMLAMAGLDTVDRTPEALLAVIEIESQSHRLGWLRAVPRPLLAAVGSILPTYVFIATTTGPVASPHSP